MSLRRRFAAVVVLLMLTAAIVTGAVWPAHRLIGVNYVVTKHTVPLWVKAVDFIDRDINMSRTADQIAAGLKSDEARAMTVFRWTERNVRPRPEGMPIVDDHVWYVIVRGYGQADQQADVFTTLVSYVGVPAYWQLIGDRPDELPLSYVSIEGKWRVFDVAHGIVFRDADGLLATAEDLARDHLLIRRAAQGHVADLDAYLRYFASFRPASAPDVTRADLQMVGRRFLYEVKKAVGRDQRVWQMRQESGR